MRQIEVEWVELAQKVTVNLDEQKNPELVELLWNNLPYQSVQTHALVSGQHLYHIAPISELVYTKARVKEDRTKSPEGTVFLSQLHHLAIKYGNLTEYLPAAAIGEVIPEDMQRLKDIGAHCWESTFRNKTPICVSVYPKGQRSTYAKLPKHGGVSDPEAQRLLDEIYEETCRIWLQPPQEILNLHNGHIQSRAGSYDHYFNTLVFLNGETRPLGYCVLGGLIRTCRVTDISLSALIQTTQNLIRTPAEFLGYCGLDKLWRFTQRALSVLGALQNKEEYYNLMATFCLYAERLNTWNLHYFPWQLGASLRFAPEGQPKRPFAEAWQNVLS